jgi:metal-responsive CopG/Arc/MetJ family transcriptional regulator
MTPSWKDDKTILHMFVEKALMERIENFRFSQRYANRTDAIKRLLDEALKKYEKKSKK